MPLQIIERHDLWYSAASPLNTSFLIPVRLNGASMQSNSNSKNCYICHEWRNFSPNLEYRAFLSSYWGGNIVIAIYLEDFSTFSYILFLTRIIILALTTTSDLSQAYLG
ncbi:MAG: hypothetical protein ACFWUL_00490 [Dialister sp.]